MLHQTSFQIINIYSISDQNSASELSVTLGTQEKTCVNQMWILENSKDLLEYIESRPISSCNSNKHLTLYPLRTYTQLFPAES